MNKLLFNITKYLPCRLINQNLERYYILPFIYLHRFISSDGDRNIHDHPWLFAFSIVLNGAYIEEVLKNDKLHWKSIRRFNFIKGTKFHKIVCTKNHTWTLFIRGPVFKRWGFLNHTTNDYKPTTPTGKGMFDYPISKHSQRAIL